jgi:PAS domain S-box-containing protein
MISEDIRHWVRSELWNQVPVAISVIDREFEIVEANRAFHATYGEWRNRPCYEVYKDRTEFCEQCAAAKTFADGQTRVREERGVGRDGKPLCYIVHMVPLVRPDGEIPYIIEMSTDITATKLLERAKLEAERLAAVGQTVAGLAHGIKNVLMGLEGGIYVFRTGMEKGDTERMMRGWGMLEENIARITSFVKEFLDFAKGRTARVAMIEPNEVAREVIDLFHDKASMAGIELRANLEEGIAPAAMDREGLHTCLVNLVSNALDACEISDKPAREVVLTSRDRDGTLVFEVSDNGTGMDYDVKKNIFTSFFSTKGSDRGTGLGLLTTRKIVQEHGGKVSFESTEGVGSVFRLEFPRDRLPQPEGKEKPEVAGISGGATRREHGAGRGQDDPGRR